MAINFQAQLDFKTKVVQSKDWVDYNGWVGLINKFFHSQSKKFSINNLIYRRGIFDMSSLGILKIKVLRFKISKKII